MANSETAAQLRKLADELDPLKKMGDAQARAILGRLIDWLADASEMRDVLADVLKSWPATPQTQPVPQEPTPSVYGCDPSEVPIPEGWERVGFARPLPDQWFLADNTKLPLEMTASWYEHFAEGRKSDDRRRIIVCRKPASSKPLRQMRGNGCTKGGCTHSVTHDETPSCIYPCIGCSPCSTLRGLSSMNGEQW